MRVRFCGTSDLSTSDPAASSFLTDNAEYLVVSLSASRKSGVKFQLLSDDETHEPGWFDAELFEITSGAIPSTWRAELRQDPNLPGYLLLAPEPFLQERFWDDYWGDGTRHYVIDEFERQIELLVREDAEASGTWV
jgi:hypothetical protein